MRITNATRGSVLASDASVAKTFWSRLVGLLGRRSLAAGRGLLVEPCRSVHTMFMLFSIDVVYIDRGRRVVKVVPGVKPFRASLGGAGAHAVIELPAGTIAPTATAAGDSLALD